MSITDPSPVKVDGHKGWWNGEVVDKGVELQHEPELVAGSDESNEEVDHKEYVES